MNLVTLQFKTTNDFNWNLDYVETLISKAPQNSFILAPELALNGYAYNRMEDAVAITERAVVLFKTLSKDKTIALTLTTKKDSHYYNTLHIFHKGKIIHTQSKIQLFVLNDEKMHFTPGTLDEMKIVDIDGFKVGAMICFELRFIDYWQKLRGADLILVPSMWGKPRKDNYETLTKALAVANQCFVLASDSANDDMAKGSGIITPFGHELRDDRKEYLSQIVNVEEITKMRTYMDVGIN